MNKIILEESGKAEWLFKESERQKQDYERLHQAEDLIDVDELDAALSLLKVIVNEMPKCMEAYNDIYLCYLYKEEYVRALVHLEQSVNNILTQLPKKFLIFPKQRLYWAFLENRAFLRLYVNLANEYFERKQLEEAMGMFEKVLQWNPNDNQGVRERVLICYFELGLYGKIIELCDMYKNDMMAAVIYARPLVLFICEELEQAKKALIKANKHLPNVAKELMKIKHIKPKEMRPERITIGGKDEAYAYWLDFGKYWKKTEGAISFVKQMLS